MVHTASAEILEPKLSSDGSTVKEKRQRTKFNKVEPSSLNLFLPLPPQLSTLDDSSSSDQGVSDVHRPRSAKLGFLPTSIESEV